MNKLNININYSELIKETIINYFTEILIYINKKYPKEFNKTKLEKYRRLIIQKINVYDTLPPKRDKYIRKAKIIARNKKIKYINKKYNGDKKTVDVINKHSKVDDKHRCQSRIFNNGLKEIKYINGMKTIIYGKQCNRKIYRGNIDNIDGINNANSSSNSKNSINKDCKDCKYCYFHLKRKFEKINRKNNKKFHDYGNFFIEPSKRIKKMYKNWNVEM